MTTTIAIPVPAYITNQGYKDWWCPCGINPADVVAAHAAKGAASYAASKVNLANPGTYDCIDTGHAPDWDDVNGWKHDGLSGYLIIPSIPYTWNSTLIIKYSNFTGIGTYLLFGTEPGIMDSETNVEHRIFISNGEGDSIIGTIGGWSVGTISPTPNPAIIASTKEGLYNYGVLHSDGYIIPNISSIHDMGIGGSPTGTWLTPIYVQSCAVYNKALTQSQIQEVGSNMP